MISCSSTPKPVDKQVFTDSDSTKISPKIEVGAEQTNQYLPLLKDKNIALVVNPTSRIKNSHLVDSLLSLGIHIKVIFAPEHGFRGDADAGEHIKNGKDSKTGLPIISLYGKNKKPDPSQLKNVDIIVFDIQDVGVRFYTYISTMHYVMEACAEQNKKMIILDRPNPNGDIVAGPILDTSKYRSFVGMHPIPIVHGCTVGELANMINGESWLKNGIKCNLTIIPCKNYTHQTPYSLPVKPSPNLNNDTSIRIYPSLCLLEPTDVSIGRGTYNPFTVLGIPYTIDSNINYTFTPKSIIGMSKYPKHKNKTCYGYQAIQLDTTLLTKSFSPIPFQYYYQLYKTEGKEKDFITSLQFLKQLIGNDLYLEYLKDKNSPYPHGEINNYILLRRKYLLYPK